MAKQACDNDANGVICRCVAHDTVVRKISIRSRSSPSSRSYSSQTRAVQQLPSASAALTSLHIPSAHANFQLSGNHGASSCAPTRPGCGAKAAVSHRAAPTYLAVIPQARHEAETRTCNGKQAGHNGHRNTRLERNRHIVVECPQRRAALARGVDLVT